MRKKRSSLAVFIGLFPLVAFAQGGVGGRGGDLSPASDAEIRAEIDKIWKKDLKYAFDALGNHLGEVRNQTLQSVFKGMYANIPLRAGDVIPPGTDTSYNYLVDPVITRTEYRIEEKNPCVETEAKAARQAAVVRDEFRDMSPEGIRAIWQSQPYERKFATVCYNLPLLRGIPRAGLHQALMALSAHEVAHLFKHPEAVAKELETFFAQADDLLEAENRVDRVLHDAVGGLEFFVGLILSDGLDKSDQLLCQNLGMIEMHAAALKNEIIWANERAQRISEPAVHLASQIQQAIENSNFFCGEIQMVFFGERNRFPVDVGPVSQGDRKAVRRYLEEVQRQLSVFAGMIRK